ncbi:MAG: cation:proton antiporter [Gammaproteobacteria bacterium]|nr:cation:proton antiporter [Gammaproteobacteria bacterium]
MNDSILIEILMLLAAAVIAVAGFRRFHLPPILAYLTVGVIVGPYGLALVSDTEDTRLLAEFGIVFLLFTVGLEFSLSQLMAVKKEVLTMGGAQVVLTTALIGSVAWLFGMSPVEAFVIGAVFAMSSTAIVVKQLAEQLELGSRHGRLSVGILLFQDVSVAPFLIIIPALTGVDDVSVSDQLAGAVIKGGIIVIAMVAVGRWLLRPLFHEIARSRSSELFTLTALLFALTAAWVTHYSGLSLALGAFLAGMMLGETEFRHQVEVDIRPFRDVLLGLFFVTIGMMLNIGLLPQIVLWVLLLALAIVLLKAVLISVLMRLLGVNSGVAVRTGIVLSQGGEFGFALLSLAMGSEILGAQLSQIMLAALIFSMILTPWLIKYNGTIAKYLCSESYLQNRAQLVQEVAQSARTLSGHTIICGYGRIGQNIARFLDQENRPYLALDLDPLRVKVAREAGEPVIYGDSAHIEILEAAGLMQARVLVISFDDIYAALKILPQVQKARPDMPVLVRTRDDNNLERLQRAGATEVIPETLEASLMLASHLLLLLEVPTADIIRHVEHVRHDRYQILREVFYGQDDMSVTGGPYVPGRRLHSVTLSAHSSAVGRRLDEIDLAALHVSVTAIRRHGIRGQNPAPDTLLMASDTLVLYGGADDLKRAEERLNRTQS